MTRKKHGIALMARFFSLFFVGAGLAASLWTGGCIGPKPATPPSIPAELPVALRFPDSVGVDVATLGVASSAAALTMTPPDDLTEFISGMGNSVEGTSRILDHVLGPLHEMGDIPVRTPLTRFVSDPVLVSGFDARQIAATVFRVDFSDFDGNGCSGSTCPRLCATSNGSATLSPSTCDAACPASHPAVQIRPVCFRVWAESQEEGLQRLLSGFFDALPFQIDDDAGHPIVVNRGAGSLQGVAIEQAVFHPTEAPDFPFPFVLYRSTYDHALPEFKKETDFKIHQTIFVDTSRPNESDELAQHATVTQRGPEATAVKTADLSLGAKHFVDGEERLTSEQSVVGRWKEGDDPSRGDGFLSGSQKVSDTIGFPFPGFELRNFNGACAEIATGTLLGAVEPNGVSGEESIGSLESCRVPIDFSDGDDPDFPNGIDVTLLPVPLFPLDFLGEGELTFETVFPDFSATPGF